MIISLKKNASFLAVLTITIIILMVNFDLKLWKVPNRIITHDVKSYYAYLPAIFIYQDIGLDTLNNNHGLNERLSAIKSSNGKYHLRYTMGNAIMYSPFFLTAHLLAPVFNHDRDGYTPPYKIALLLSSTFFLLLGLFFLRKYLIQYYHESIVAFSFFTIVIGTNLLFYATIEAPMSHSYGFALISIFIYLTFLWYRKQSFLTTLLFGFVFGLIVLMRPSNIIVLIFFVLFEIGSFKDLKERVILFSKKFYLIFIMMIPFFLVWLPQFLYWKHVSGHYLYYSYEDQGFFFNNPQIFKSLFSYKKGWLLYTPIMTFALFGLFLLRKYQKGMILPIAIFLVLNIYLLSSWFQWYFGGSFGLRAYIDSYSILVIPFAALCQYMFSRKLWIKISFLVIVLSLVYLNIFQTRQYYTGAIHWVNMNKEAYWENFGKLKPTQRFIDIVNKRDTVQPNFKSETEKDSLYKVKYISLYDRMTSDSAWMNVIKRKALSRNIPLDTMMKLDIQWMIEQNRKKAPN